jgi:low affinity Fe/Cu permease
MVRHASAEEDIMARKNKHSRNGAKHSGAQNSGAKSSTKNAEHKAALAPHQSLFTRFACAIAHWSGKPGTFLLAVVVVVSWAASGPYFGYSDTWQLVINTGTTIVTFLMVFLIQNTQNRDTMALQIKLAELIFVMQGAKNKLATVEDLSDDELEKLHEEYRTRAEHTFVSLSKRRASREKH